MKAKKNYTRGAGQGYAGIGIGSIQMHQRRVEQECGGTPDAMLLPRLIDYLNTSVDYLFGRGRQEPERLSDLVLQKLKGLRRSKQLELVFEIRYVMENAIGKIPHHEALPDQENFMMQGGAELLLYQVLHDDVYSRMCLNKESHYFSYAPQPSRDFLHMFPAQKEFEELLAFLDKPHCFAMLYQLSKCPQGRGFQVKGFMKKLSIEEADTAQILQDLKKWQIAHKIQLEKEKGLEPICVLDERLGFLPVPPFMAAYIQSGILYGYFAMDREFPILNGEVSHEWYQICGIQKESAEFYPCLVGLDW